MNGLLEESYRRILAAFEPHVGMQKYLFGSRPSLAAGLLLCGGNADPNVFYNVNTQGAQAYFASKGELCIQVITRWYDEISGELECEIPCVISNHDDLRSMVEWHGIPFHHVPVTPDSKAEAYAGRVNLLVAPCVSPWAYERIHRWNADAICMSSRGVGPVERLLTGSVATDVIQRADCPVLATCCQLFPSHSQVSASRPPVR